jgi:hypothetical protein
LIKLHAWFHFNAEFAGLSTGKRLVSVNEHATIWRFNVPQHVTMRSMMRDFALFIRWTRQNLYLFAVTCVGLCLPVTPCHAKGYAAQVGQVHPDFTLPRLGDGEPVSLSQFRGRRVLLIHFGSW